MSDPSLSQWRRFQADLVLCAVRWCLRDALGYRDVAELLQKRGVRVDRTTAFRWAQRHLPELDKRCRPQLKVTNDSYRVDETYITNKKQRYYLYRAVDSTGATLDFMLSAPRDAKAAEQGFSRWPHNERSLSLSSPSDQFLHHYPKAFALSGNNRTRLDKRQGVLPARPLAAESRPAQAIHGTEPGAMDRLLIHRQLMTPRELLKARVLCAGRSASPPPSFLPPTSTAAWPTRAGRTRSYTGRRRP